MKARRISYPYPPYARRVALSSGSIWFVLHLISLVIVQDRTPPFHVGVIVVSLTAVLVWLDGRKFREHLFHANLGTSTTWTVGESLLIAGALEILARILFAAHA